MGSVDWTKLWTYVNELEERVARPEVVPHEETDLHRVFCDEHYCIEHGADDAVSGMIPALPAAPPPPR
jgi:hypothetical protein